MTDTIDELAQKIAEKIADPLPWVPLSERQMTIADIAAYRRLSARHIAEREACRPDFPKPIALPTDKGRGHKAYLAVEIFKYYRGFQAKRG